MEHRPAIGAGLFALVLASGCSDGGFPKLHIPQLQEARELGHYGTERTRAARACAASSATVEGYVACMQAAGWVFIARGATYPADDCWRLRDAADSRALPPAQCFHRVGSPPEGAEASEPTTSPAE